MRPTIQNVYKLIGGCLLSLCLLTPAYSEDQPVVVSHTFVAVPDHPYIEWKGSATTREERGLSHQSRIRSLRKSSDIKPSSPNQLSPLNHQSTGQPLSDSQLLKANLVHRQNVDMFLGEVKVLTDRKVKRVAIGRGDVLRAEVLESGELLVIAESAGSSSMRLWYEDGEQADFNIRVTEHDPETRFRMEKMVRMRVRMVEFRKSALTRLGIDWADALNGPTLGTAGDALGNPLFRPSFDGFEGLPNQVQPFSTYFGIATNLTSHINLMATSGDAKILAEPVLSGTNGGKASFLAGGEVPYPSVGSNGEPIVEFKEYGIRLDVEPRIDSGGNVRALVKTEISQLDSAVTIQGTPGLLTRKAQTEVNVRSGQTIVISGLLSSESSKDINRLPGIGRLPILGRLFRSDNVRNNVSELVIFITPEVVDPQTYQLSQRDGELHEQALLQAETARDKHQFFR